MFSDIAWNRGCYINAHLYVHHITTLQEHLSEVIELPQKYSALASLKPIQRINLLHYHRNLTMQARKTLCKGFSLWQMISTVPTKTFSQWNKKDNLKKTNVLIAWNIRHAILNCTDFIRPKVFSQFSFTWSLICPIWFVPQVLNLYHMLCY